MKTTSNINVVGAAPLAPPATIKQQAPLSETAIDTVIRGRQTIQSILTGEDRRLLAVVGPCSIHDRDAALDYARRLSEVATAIQDHIMVVMRVYFEKPRTTVGWKGLINDPNLDGSCDMGAGLRRARQILLDITEMGLPTGTEMLDPITPQYLADLVSWGAIGARTTESQTHRQMASGLSMPIGFKNSTDGSLQNALDAMQAARSPHWFIGIDEEGRTCIFHTRGNPWGHVILRGGRSGPNYHIEDVERAAAMLQTAGLPPHVMIDCSHANSCKDFRKQGRAWKDALRQRVEGGGAIMGLMLESNLREGSQPIVPGKKLEYGVSITDACLGWEATRDLLLYARDVLAAGR